MRYMRGSKKGATSKERETSRDADLTHSRPPTTTRPHCDDLSGCMSLLAYAVIHTPTFNDCYNYNYYNYLNAEHR